MQKGKAKDAFGQLEKRILRVVAKKRMRECTDKCVFLNLVSRDTNIKWSNRTKRPKVISILALGDTMGVTDTNVHFGAVNEIFSFMPSRQMNYR
jgi:hypothetical protein